MKPVYLNIALPVPLRRTFHYLPPEGCAVTACLPGCRVEVPFRRGSLIGIICGHSDTSEFEGSIKSAHRLIDAKPVFEEKVWALCLWAAEYYHHPIGETLHTALPAQLRQGETADGRVRKLVAKTYNVSELQRAPRQLALLRAIEPAGLSRSELNGLDFSASIIRSVIAREAAEWQESPMNLEPSAPPKVFGNKLPLSEEQEAALDGIKDLGTHLLFGVTGSGKTEVYLQLIEAKVRKGKQALVLVPEIGLTPQTVARFEARFPGFVAAMHSGMNDSERLNVWRQARSGKIAVVIGTRSAVFTPLLNPGVIVVDEEHDASFKQQDGFRYSARDLAVKRGQLEEIPIVLGSATPSLETYANAKSDRYHRLDLKQRANSANFAQYQIMGTEHQTLREGLSPELIEMMQSHLKKNNQVLLFLNRRGFAPVLHCRQCRWLSNCARCDSRMTFHITNRSLICHHCDSRSRAPRVCPDCGSSELVPLGLGTQRIEQGLMELFPDETIVRIDRDSTRAKHALEARLAEINKGEPCILLGTQLLAKGHHFPDVTLVAVIDLDSGLFSSDFHAIERMGQLLLQVGGRSGRAEKPGTVAIQTLYPDQPMLKLLTKQGYEAFCQELLQERKANDLPPFYFQAIVRAEATKANTALNFLESLSQTPSHPTVELLGPIPAPMEKRAGRFRAQLLISASRRGSLHQTLKQIVITAEQSKLVNQVRWSVDVDPYDLF